MVLLAFEEVRGEEVLGYQVRRPPISAIHSVKVMGHHALEAG